MQSCNNQENDDNNSFLELESTKSDPTIDFDIIESLNESNQKNIQLSNSTFGTTKNLQTLQLLLKIKKNHENIDYELKKITKKNLIVIPKLTNKVNLNADSLKSKKATIYLLQLLKSQIKTEIKLLDSIKKTCPNIDFKIFALKSKKILDTNNELLNTTLIYSK